jgi:hypothetical protein
MSVKITKCKVLGDTDGVLIWEVGKRNVKAIYRMLDVITNEPTIIIAFIDGRKKALNNLKTILTYK